MRKRFFITMLVGMMSLALAISAVADDRFRRADHDRWDRHHSSRQSGAVFVMSNDADGNAIIMYNRKANGKLKKMDTFPTGGLGSGVGLTVPIDPLGSQNSLVLTPDGKHLYAVNAGDDTITLFEVKNHYLKFLHRMGSGGRFPVSVAVFGKLIYVLNAGANDGSSVTPSNITGFMRKGQRLEMIPDSTRYLIESPQNPEGSGDVPNILATPAQVQFSPYGELLVVTIKDALTATNSAIWVYEMMESNGHVLPAHMPFQYPTAGPAPFGFTFDTFGRLIVTDAGVSTVTAYNVDADNVEIIGTPAETGQAATCWIVATRPFARYVYAANTGSGNLTGYRVRLDGTLHEIGLFPVGDGALNIDLAVSRDGRYLYTQNGGFGTVSIFRIGRKGALKHRGDIEVTEPVSGFQGIAAW